MERYSLNLSPRYVSEWGAWEVSREIICNAIDADPDGMNVKTNGSDELVVTTSSVPDLSELFVIGAGTKSAGGSTIGQFGEGFKMAALAATRTQGGSLTVNIPGKSVTFDFAQSLGVDVLHAEVNTNPLHDSGCEIVVKMPGIAFAFAGRLLPERSDRKLPKAAPDTTRIYCKGVYIGEIKQTGIWDWNLSAMKINRDRSMIDASSAWCAVASFFESNMDDDTAQALVDRPLSWESYHALYFCADKTANQKLMDAFYRVYGEKSVIASEDFEANGKAKSLGYKVVECGMGIKKCLRSSGVKEAFQVVPLDHELESIDTTKYIGQIARLRKLDDVIGAPGSIVRVFANRADHFKGMAMIQDNVVWLSEGLFTPGNELELTRTYLHETGHLMSSAGDATTQFENALDGIAGRLALAWLGPVLVPVGDDLDSIMEREG